MMKIIRNLSLRRCFTTKECPGCGATFQKSQPNHAGYLPEISPKDSVSEQELQEIKLKKGPLSVREAKLLINSTSSASVICKRCHSKSGSKRTISLKSNVVQFANLKINSGGLVIVVLDLLDLHGTLINNIHEYVGQKDMIVVLNKADLMPKGYNFHKVKQYLKHKPSIQNCSDLFEISAKTGQGIPQLLKHMENAFMKNEDCYMVGCTSVGKSSLFNYLKVMCSLN
jgi:putative ribosome biogenesis GTPase RsgA